MLLTVVIPTRNRSARVAGLLDSLAGQDPVSFEWEVVVVDNGSTDDTLEVVESKSSTLPIRVRWVEERRPGLHQGRHRGAHEATGAFVGFLDDDMVLARSWIQGVERLARGKVEAVMGRIPPKWEAEPPDWLLGMVHEGTLGYLGLFDRGTRPRPLNPRLVYGGNCFLPRTLLFDLGGFHPDGVPDDLLMYRGDGEGGLMLKFERAGLRAWYDPRATAYHVIGADRMSVDYLCRRAFNEGVSYSFTEMRSGHFGTDDLAAKRDLRYFRKRRREMTGREIVTSILRKLMGGPPPGPAVPADVRIQLEAAFGDGLAFHRDAVKSDPELYRHVVREHFLESDLWSAEPRSQ